MNSLTPIDENLSFEQRYQKAYHKIWWQENKDRYKRRHIERLGNPEQDKQILEFIKKKREGTPTPKYKALSDTTFKHNNHAFYPKYKDEIVGGYIANE